MMMLYAKPGEQPARFGVHSQREMRLEVFVKDLMPCWLSGAQVLPGEVCYAYEEDGKIFICSHAAYQSLVDRWMRERK